MFWRVDFAEAISSYLPAQKAASDTIEGRLLATFYSSAGKMQ
jgi:hypothetical protein